MTTLVLTLNEAAVAQLNNHTRVRVKIQKRGGVEHIGLRPSYRVAGVNSSVRTTANDDGTVTIEIPPEMVAKENLPEVKNHGVYQMVDIGYCWFILKEATGGKDDDPAQITIAKRKGKKSAQHAAATVVTPADGSSDPAASENPTDPVAVADKVEDGQAAPDDLQAAGDAEAQAQLEQALDNDTAGDTQTEPQGADTAEPAGEAAPATPEASTDAAPETVEKQIKTPKKSTKKLVDAA